MTEMSSLAPAGGSAGTFDWAYITATPPIDVPSKQPARLAPPQDRAPFGDALIAEMPSRTVEMPSRTVEPPHVSSRQVVASLLERITARLNVVSAKSVACASTAERDVARLLESVYSRFANGEVMGPLHELSFELDDWLHEGKRDHIEQLLITADPERLRIHGLLAILTDTRPARDEFPPRALFVARAHEYVCRVAPERAARLLRSMS